MRLADIVITAAVVAGLSAPALAQDATAQALQTTNPPAANPAPVPAPATYNNATYTDYNGHWVASGFVGTNFATGFSGSSGSNPLGINTEDSTTSINFGGQVAYLWGGWVGVEGLAEFSPSFEIADILFENKPDVNTYMGNGIAAYHFGSQNQYMPYVSGGVGAIQLHSTIFLFNPDDLSDLTPIGTLSHTGSRFGWDLGAGGMGFVGRWGFRGDVRYYRTTVDNNLDLVDLGTGSTFTNAVLSGLSFWKANVGVAFRW